MPQPPAVKPTAGVKPTTDEATVTTDVEQTEVEKATSKPIEVEVTKKSYYKRRRWDEGMKLHFDTIEEVPSWVKCVDPKLEAQRVLLLKAKLKKNTNGK